MVRNLVIIGLCISLSACSGDTTNTGPMPNTGADAPSNNDMILGGDSSDAGVTLCYQGWSGNSDCCLSETSKTASASGCEAGWFTQAECSRLDPICETTDFGGPEPDMDR